MGGGGGGGGEKWEKLEIVPLDKRTNKGNSDENGGTSWVHAQDGEERERVCVCVCVLDKNIVIGYNN